jgi:hypothetical protein
MLTDQSVQTTVHILRGQNSTDGILLAALSRIELETALVVDAARGWPRMLADIIVLVSYILLIVQSLSCCKVHHLNGKAI